jgi:hypothetical protein
VAVGIGANAQLMLDGFDLTGYFRQFDVALDKDVLDTTVFGLGSRSKQVGLRRASLSGSAFADMTATIGSWDVLVSRWPSGTAGTYAFGPQGFTLGNQIFTIYSEAVKFQVQAVVDDLMRLTTEAEARANAADMGVSLHALAPETSFPFTGTAVDNLALTSNGGVGAVHVSAIAGGAPNVVYKIQHAAVSTYADLITFTAITTANSFQRVEVAAGTTVNRNLRMTITNGGTTSSVTGLVTFARR